jgi:hypothetical protein
MMDQPNHSSPKPVFLEDYAAAEVDPLTEACAEFDYEQVYRDLDGDVDWQDDDLNQKLAQLLRHIFQFALDTELSAGADRRIGRRFLALAWVVDPSLFAGSPSLAKLAARLGTDSATLSRLTSEATRTFGITNRCQARWLSRQRKQGDASPKEDSHAG